MNTVDIIIPTYGLPEVTVAGLASLKRAGGDYRIIWVDDGSQPADVEIVERFLLDSGVPHMSVKLSRNMGFVRAVNAGLVLARAPYVAVLNNDIEVPPGWLEPLVETAGHEDVGIVGVIESGAGEKGSQEFSVMHEAFRQRFDRGEAVDVVMVSLFCAVLPRRTLQKVGLLSAAYEPGFCDDDDYCERIKAAGLRCVVKCSVMVQHRRRTTWKAAYAEDAIREMIRVRTAQFEARKPCEGFGWACVRPDAD